MLPELFKRVKPLFGKLIDVLWIEYQTADVKRKTEIEELLTLLTVKYIGVTVGEQRVLLEPPPKHLVGRGDYYVGNVIYPSIKAYPFMIGRDELLRHIFILGPTGTGKSTLILNFLQHFLRDGKPFMVFDFKRNYRCLLSTLGSERLIVFTVGRATAPLRLNAMKAPPGVSFEEWVEALADVISAAYILMQGARNVLKEAFLQACREKKERVTLSDAYRILDMWLRTCRSGSRKYGWIESSARSVEELVKGGFGASLNAQNGLSIEELLSWPVVFELEGLGVDQKRFFCLYFLQAVLLVRKKQELQRERFRHCLVFDESHHIFPRQKPGVHDVPSLLAREVREYGEAIIAATQQVDVSESLIANAGFKFILRCDYPDDVMFASRLMNLETRLFPSLPVGFAIVRLPVRHYTPFLIAFKMQPVKNEWVNDARVASRYAGHVLGKQKEELVVPVQKTLSERERGMLLDIVHFPIASTTERYSRLGLNPKTGNEVKDRLLADELICVKEITNPEGKTNVLCLAPIGEALLGAHQTRRDNRSGGVHHEFWRQFLKRKLLGAGYDVQEEVPIGAGKTVDMLGSKNGKRIYIEIETGRSNFAENVRKCGSLVGVVVFFFTEKSLVAKYQPIISEKENTNFLFLCPSDIKRLQQIINP
jgi:hypothetical protein